MSVEFEQEKIMQNYIPSSHGGAGYKGIIGWLLKKEVVKTTTGANVLLLSASIVFITIAIIWPYTFNRSNVENQIVYREDVTEFQLGSIPENQRVDYIQSLPSKYDK